MNEVQLCQKCGAYWRCDCKVPWYEAPEVREVIASSPPLPPWEPGHMDDLIPVNIDREIWKRIILSESRYVEPWP